MTGKELLAQYTDLQEEIKELKRRINRLEKMQPKYEKDNVKGSSLYFPYTEQYIHIEGYNIQDADKREQRIITSKNLLGQRKEKCEYAKLKIEDFINAISDSRTRRVFQYRYIDNLSWQAIARKIGRFDESYPRKMIHDKYLKSL